MASDVGHRGKELIGVGLAVVVALAAWSLFLISEVRDLPSTEMLPLKLSPGASFGLNIVWLFGLMLATPAFIGVGRGVWLSKKSEDLAEKRRGTVGAALCVLASGTFVAVSLWCVDYLNHLAGV